MLSQSTPTSTARSALACPNPYAPVGARGVLVTGWFSFDTAEVTAGDLLAQRTVSRWLDDAGIDHDVAMAATFRRRGQLAWHDVPPATVGHLVFVCGPAGGELVEELFARFTGSQRVAVGVSVVDRTPALAPVTVLARDEPGRAAVDLALGTAHRPVADVAVAAVIRSHSQPEYGNRQRHDGVHRCLDGWLTGTDLAVVELDTRLHPGDARQLSTPEQFAAAVARVDVVVTTRLHGLVLGLAAGVPVVAVDPVAGGGKVGAQARALGWPAVISAEAVSHDAFDEAVGWCRSAEGRDRVAACTEDGRAALLTDRDRLVELLRPVG